MADFNEPTRHPKYEKYPDSEERALAFAADAKDDAIAGLVMAAEARKARGAETLGIEESIEFERMTLSGYRKALDKRRRELAIAGGTLVR